MKNTRIAIVDDHVLFLHGLSSLLSKSEGIEVVFTASNGRELLDRLKEGNLPDVIFLDLDMPEMDGIETMKRLRNEYPEVKVLILSMHEDQALVLHLIEEGAHGYLLKNSTLDELLRSINSVSTQGFYYDEFVIRIMRNGLVVKKRSPISLKNNTVFTTRELEVLELICKEYTAAEISEKLFLSQRTIEGHKMNLFQKTNTKNTVGLILFCLKNGVIDLEDV